MLSCGSICAGPSMTSTGECEFSIIMPCLNEAETIGTCIEKAKRGIDAAGISAEIVIGDNGSNDGSQEIARQNGARVVDIPQRGYGAALFGASQASRGKYIIMGDSDDSYDFTRLERFVKALRDGYDLVMGNRFAGGIAPGAMPWKNRYIGNPVLSGIGRLFFNSPARDFHCGIRGFSRDAFELLDLRTTGMEFASEMVIKATLRGMRITEVPTTLSPDGRSRPPHLRPWRDGWRHLRFMLLYSPRWLFLIPGIALVVGGLVLGFRLYLGPMRIGSVSFDVSTMIYAAAAVLIGFQAVAFSVFTKAYAIEARLVPKDVRFARWMRYMQLERGIAVGAVLLLAGLVDTGFAVHHWSEAGFGALDPESAVRAVVPAAVAMALGVQVIFGSFVLAVLQLNTRDS
jgi:glycosyltransferase involved in cell wall biosynthesis